MGLISHTCTLITHMQVSHTGHISLSAPCSPRTPATFMFPFQGCTIVAPLWATNADSYTDWAWYRVTNSPELLARSRLEIESASNGRDVFNPAVLFITTWQSSRSSHKASDNLCC